MIATHDACQVSEPIMPDTTTAVLGTGWGRDYRSSRCRLEREGHHIGDTSCVVDDSECDNGAQMNPVRPSGSFPPRSHIPPSALGLCNLRTKVCTHTYITQLAVWSSQSPFLGPQGQRNASDMQCTCTGKRGPTPKKAGGTVLYTRRSSWLVHIDDGVGLSHRPARRHAVEDDICTDIWNVFSHPHGANLHGLPTCPTRVLTPDTSSQQGCVRLWRLSVGESTDMRYYVGEGGVVNQACLVETAKTCLFKHPTPEMGLCRLCGTHLDTDASGGGRSCRIILAAMAPGG